MIFGNDKNTNIGLHGSIVASQSLHQHTIGQHWLSISGCLFLVRKIIIPVLFLMCTLFMLTSCSISKQISKQADIILKDSAAGTGHIGISVYEPATGNYWYNHNATKYFVPASNTKLFSLYAGLKYLGDSLVAFRYNIENDSTIALQPAGDPTFLHPEFTQPAYNFLSRFKQIEFTHPLFTANFLGGGWAWDDYKESYLVQRSNFPVYGNLIHVEKSGYTVKVTPPNQLYTIAEQEDLSKGFDVTKAWDDNNLAIIKGTNQNLFVPFKPTLFTIIEMLQDTLRAKVVPEFNDTATLKNVLHSQPVDSLFIPMMHRSDNFFAEQTLLMASNEHLGYMSDDKMINTLLSKDLADIPQRPKWVDGSGLSRYNLFTPQDFVYILNKMKNEFGLERLKHILPTGGTGTISSYYKNEAGYIFAKTGTLSNHCALSGFIITRKNKLLIFSVLANDYITGATPIRKAVEKFLIGIRNKY